MKKLFEQTSRGYSWHNTHTYYICESAEEYNSLVDKYRDYENNYEEYDSFLRRNITRTKTTQYYVNVQISCEPQTIVSDGFATYGGKKLKCRGIKRVYKSGCSTDYSSYDYFIDPTSITEFSEVKAENWWV